MKTSTLLRATVLILLCATLAIPANAQLDLPRGSQMATVSQRIGITDVEIEYSRPKVNDREIWGKLVPYGMNNLGFGTAKESPWRAGANENTTITFSDAVMLDGKKVAAGTYGLHLVVNENNTATYILSKDANAWGSYFYEPSNDVARVEISTTTVPHREFLTFEFTEVNPTDATLSLLWEKKSFPLKIEVPVNDLVMSKIAADLKGQKGFTKQSWEQAARFAFNNGGDLSQALSWVNAAREGNFFSQKDFGNTALKAQILLKMEKKAEAMTLVDEAADMASMNQLNALGYQMLQMKEHDRALRFFKQNVKNNPENANVHDSLGDAYKQMGDKKNAVKHLKKALSLNPNANVKAHSEKLLAELNAS